MGVSSLWIDDDSAFLEHMRAEITFPPVSNVDCSRPTFMTGVYAS